MSVRCLLLGVLPVLLGLAPAQDEPVVLDALPELSAIQAHEGRARAVSYCPTGDGRIATGGDDNTTRIWNADGTEEVTIRGHVAAIWSVDWHPDGDRLVTAEGKGAVRVWTDSGRMESVTQLTKGLVTCARWAPDGAWILSAGADAFARVTDLFENERQRVQGFGGFIWSAAWAPEGDRFVTGHAMGQVIIWPLEPKEILTVSEPKPLQRRVDRERRVIEVAWFPSGGRIVAAGNEKIHIITEAGELLERFGDHPRPVWALDIAPHGHLIATGGETGTLRIWDAAGNKLVGFTTDHGRIGELAFSPDGSQLATVGDDGMLRVWDVSGVAYEEYPDPTEGMRREPVPGTPDPPTTTPDPDPSTAAPDPAPTAQKPMNPAVWIGIAVALFAGAFTAILAVRRGASRTNDQT